MPDTGIEKKENTMEQAQLRRFSRLVEFLGIVLGPDYEVVLQDVSREQPCIVAIANGQISGRTIGAPLTNVALRLIQSKAYETSDWKLNYRGISANGRLLRCSTYFIKDGNGALQGLLCMNFDDSRYRELSSKIYSLCHPDDFIERSNSFFAYNESSSLVSSVSSTSPLKAASPDTIVKAHPAAEEEAQGDFLRDEPVTGQDPAIEEMDNESEHFYNNIESTTKAALQTVLNGADIPTKRLSRQDKLRIVRLLNMRGVFMLKGAIPIVAQELSCSQATLYRYISIVRGEESTAG